MTVVKFTPDHLRVEFDLGIAKISATSFTDSLPEIPALGQEIRKGDKYFLSGKVTEVNPSRQEWLFKLALSRPGELSALLNEKEYKNMAKFKD